MQALAEKDYTSPEELTSAFREALKSNMQGRFRDAESVVVDHETRKDAMVHPDKYKSLTVRLYGFSEYFVSLPKFQQLAILNRTVYNG